MRAHAHKRPRFPIVVRWADMARDVGVETRASKRPAPPAVEAGRLSANRLSPPPIFGVGPPRPGFPGIAREPRRSPPRAVTRSDQGRSGQHLGQGLRRVQGGVDARPRVRCALQDTCTPPLPRRAAPHPASRPLVPGGIIAAPDSSGGRNPVRAAQWALSSPFLGRGRNALNSPVPFMASSYLVSVPMRLHPTSFSRTASRALRKPYDWSEICIFQRQRIKEASNYFPQDGATNSLRS